MVKLFAISFHFGLMFDRSSRQLHLIESADTRQHRPPSTRVGVESECSKLCLFGVSAYECMECRVICRVRTSKRISKSVCTYFTLSSRLYRNPVQPAIKGTPAIRCCPERCRLLFLTMCSDMIANQPPYMILVDLIKAFKII